MDASVTAMERTNESEPIALVAVIVKSVEDKSLGGAPVMIPVLESSVSPAGSGGLTENDAGVPLVTTGVLGAILVPFTKTAGNWEYPSKLGTMSSTAIDTVKVSEPPVFEAVTVCACAAVITEGVPVMIPVLALIARPDGSTGETEYATTAPPDVLGLFGAGTAVFLV